MNSTTEEIKSRINIVDLVGEYVKLQKVGVNWKACCPFHNEKTPSFIVNEEKQFWHCFGCGRGGDIFSFLMEIEGFQFREALEILAERTGVELKQYQSRDDFQIKNEILNILELSTKFYEKQLFSGINNKAFEYLKSRGLKESTIREFRLGYAPVGWRNIFDFLIKQGFSRDKILKSGLIIEKDNGKNHYDRFRNRIVFPIADIAGKIIGYSARIMPGDDSQAKYINTPETEVYHKSNVLYGMHKAKTEIKNRDEVLLVEGNMDVIMAHQSGVRHTVAISGTALTSEQLKIIKRYTGNIKMFFDMDDAGQKASKKSTKLAFEEDLNVFIVKVSGAKDAAEIAITNLKEFLLAIKNASPAMEYFLKNLLKIHNKKSIVARKKIILELGELINAFSNEIEREYWIRFIATELNISENILFDAFNKQRNLGNIKQNNFIEQQVIINEGVLEEYRIKNIQIEIMGLLLSNSDIWRKVVQNKMKKIEKLFTNEKIIGIIKLGERVNFDFEKLLNFLDNENQKKFLRELFLKNLEKNDYSDIENKEEELAQSFYELKKEKNKKDIEKIIKKIKSAEENGDKKLRQTLMRKLANISK